jgi:hypothetical protein
LNQYIATPIRSLANRPRKHAAKWGGAPNIGKPALYKYRLIARPTDARHEF